jgi:hypothetical protein
MKRSSFLRPVQQALLAVPASALMLGAAQAGTTVGLNFQAWYYDSSNTPQTIGFNNGYSDYATTGFPVTAKAFGVDVSNWSNTDPLGPASAVDQACTFGGTSTNFADSLSCFVNAPLGTYFSGAGSLLSINVSGTYGPSPGTNYPSYPVFPASMVVPPGDDEVAWAEIYGNTNNPFSISASGLAAKFPHGYVIQGVAGHGYNGGEKDSIIPPVELTDGTTTNLVSFSNDWWYVTNNPNAQWLYSVVALSDASGVFTANTITINSRADLATNGEKSALAGFIITDQPVVSQKPVGGIYNDGASVTLSGGAFGISPITYQWQHAGTNIPGATTASYNIPSAGPADGGDYTLVAANTYGTGTSVVASVTIVQAPTIFTDIQSATNFLTMSQRFAVIVGGALPLAYQWTHAGTNLPAATNAALVLANLQAVNAGNYTCVVTNSAGSVTSSVALLSLVSSLPYEGFAYASGDIGGQSGGAGWAGAWSQDGSANGGNSVSTPTANYFDASNQLVTSGGCLLMGASGSADFIDDRQLAATVGGAGSVYISFIGGFTNGGWEGIQLMHDSSDACFLGQGWAYESWGCGSFPYPEVLTTKSSQVQSFVVYRFDYTDTNVQVSIYVNPTLAAEPATADATGSLNLFTFNEVVVKAHAVNAGVLDELRIGGTWASVTPFTARTDPPVILTDLAGTTNFAYAGGSARMAVVASGAPALHYVWKQNGTTTVGTDSAILTLTSLTAGIAAYSVTVTNAYGVAHSQTDYLTVVAAPNLYAHIVGADAPGAWWPLNETNGSIAYDYSGAGNNGIQNGTIAFGSPGPQAPSDAGFGTSTLAYQFDGSSGFVSCGTGPSLSGTTDFSVEAWINTLSSAEGAIVQQRYSAGYNGEYELDVDADGTLYFMVYGGDAYQCSFNSPTNSTLVNDGNWHYVAAVRSGTNCLIYIDGLAAATASGPVAPLDPTFPVNIGSDQRDQVNYFNGSICEVAIYNYALPAASIASHLVAGLVGTGQLLQVVPSGKTTALSWQIGTLESSPSLSPATWTPVPNATSPYLWLPGTNSTMFYRIGL